ncbi:MAG TPA: hypothetical protein VIO94_12795 [Phenylobacterium sp.]
MDKGFLIQFAGSVAAVGALVAISAWARIAKPNGPLTPERARELLMLEFARTVDAIWVSSDGRGAIGRSGVLALVIYQVGDSYVTRHMPWASALASTLKDGRLRLELREIGAPAAVLAMDAWPPKDLAA